MEYLSCTRYLYEIFHVPRYKNEFDVEPAAYKALEGFVYKNSHSKERKKGSEPLFDKLSVCMLLIELVLY